MGLASMLKIEERGIKMNEDINEIVEELQKEDHGALVVKGFERNRKSETKVEYFGTITDPKLLFNLESACDKVINDVVDEKIRVNDILIKKITKTLDEAIVIEETGEIKEFETTLISILVDIDGTSYVTKSKTFAFNLINLGETFGDRIKEGVDMQIVKVPVKNSTNKALSFKLI